MIVSNYDTITNRSADLIPGATINSGCGPVSVPSWGPSLAGPGTNVAFVSQEETSYVVDPSKGRQWRKLRASGAIVMSPYYHGSVKIQRYVSSIDRSFTHASYYSDGRCATTGQCATFGPIPATTRWTENSHIDLLSTLPRKGESFKDLMDQVPDAISSTQQQAYAQAMSAYDLLTELGELRETFAFLMGKVGGAASLIGKLRDSDPVAYQEGHRKNAKALSKSADAALRKLGGRWMEYRYAIMPIVYSIKDVSSVLDSLGAKYHTVRAKEVISPSHPLYIKTDDYLYTVCNGAIEVRSLTKASYDLGSLQRLAATIGMNPFKTAWELVPLSFVVDWFLNVGDAIASFTSIDYSTQRAGCSVVKVNVTEEVRHARLVRDHVYWEFPVNQCGYRPPHWDVLFSRDYDNLVQTTEHNTYSRTLWTRPDPKIVVNPFLSWKRMIDGLVLGYQPIKKLLRSLK